MPPRAIGFVAATGPLRLPQGRRRRRRRRFRQTLSRPKVGRALPDAEPVGGGSGGARLSIEMSKMTRAATAELAASRVCVYFGTQNKHSRPCFATTSDGPHSARLIPFRAPSNDAADDDDDSLKSTPAPLVQIDFFPLIRLA